MAKPLFLFVDRARASAYPPDTARPTGKEAPMAEPDRHGEPESNRELTDIFKELGRALTLVRELANLLERVARKLTELEKGQAHDERA
jgi:hypothetical protein